MLYPWFWRPMKQLSAKWPHGSAKARRKFKQRYRPALHQLEDRIAPSVVNWIGGSGDWENASNWQDATTGMNHVPGPNDDAVINVAGISVTHSTGADTVKSLTLNDPLSLTGGTLTVTGTVQGGDLGLVGGTLSQATVLASTNLAVATPNAGTLNDVTLSGLTLNWALRAGVTAGLTVTDGLTLQNATVNVPADSTLTFEGSQTLAGTGTVALSNNVTGASNGQMLISDGSLLTIASGITVAGSGYIGGIGPTGTGQVSNQGSIIAYWALTVAPGSQMGR
jgi:hypothetical protein